MSDEQKRTASAAIELQAAPVAQGGVVALARGMRRLVSWRRGGTELVAGSGADKPTLAFVPSLRGRFPFYLTSFIGCVVLPSIAALIYLAWIASDQFVAETRFAVRTAPAERINDPTIKNALTSASNGQIPQMAGQDAFVVAHYLRSRGALTDISKKLDLRTMFTRPEADFWARLPKNASSEDFEDYWRGMVKTAVDGPSGIVSVTVQAFTPADAKAIADAMIEVSEALVNQMSARARQDALLKAEDEVRRTEARVRQSLQALRQFRDSEGMIDPQSSAASTSRLLLNAMADRIRVQNDLFVASRVMAPNAPSLTALKNRLDSIEQQIDSLRAQMTGNSPEARTVSGAIVRYETLELERIFSERMHLIAQNALERARMRADQKQIYISVFVPPHLPEESRYPERLAMSLIIPLVLLVLWGIVALTAASVEDHLD